MMKSSLAGMDSVLTWQRGKDVWNIATSLSDQNNYLCLLDFHVLRIPFNRCNKIIDCPGDSSDEDNCNMINFDKTYKKGFAPVTVDPDKNIIKTKIDVSVNLLNILKIDDVDSTFSCQINLLLSWFDERLNFNNLKEDPNYNTLSDDVRNNIWTPKIVFSNTIIGWQ